jgi:hypothetical protein
VFSQNAKKFDSVGQRDRDWIDTLFIKNYLESDTSIWVYTESVYGNGVLNGEFKTYLLDNGVLLSISNYKNGKITGSSTTFYLSGSIKSDDFFSDSINLSKSWYPNGQLKDSLVEKEDFQFHITYFENGCVEFTEEKGEGNFWESSELLI